MGCRCQTRACSYRDKAASFSSNSSEEAPQSSWKARFMTDDEIEQQAEKDSNGTASEEPFLVRKAKERFWGRMAVISLGVSLQLAYATGLYTRQPAGIQG